jgi:hypothetical protein
MRAESGLNQRLVLRLGIIKYLSGHKSTSWPIPL